MLPLVLSCAMSFAFSDAGRVEVEGLVITAVAKPSPFGFARSDAGGEYELEFSVSAKVGVAKPICQFGGPVRVLGVDEKPISTPSRFGMGAAVRNTGPDRWSIPVGLKTKPTKTLHAVEGTISFAPSQWKTVTFEGAKLKRNAVVPLEGGSAKLTVLDLDDEQPEIRFRVSLANADPGNVGNIGARATLIDALGKETLLSPGGTGSRVGGNDVEYRLGFRFKKEVSSGSPRMLKLEMPFPKGPLKTVAFRIREVPVEEENDKGRAKR